MILTANPPPTATRRPPLTLAEVSPALRRLARRKGRSYNSPEFWIPPGVLLSHGYPAKGLYPLATLLPCKGTPGTYAGYCSTWVLMLTFHAEVHGSGLLAHLEGAPRGYTPFRITDMIERQCRTSSTMFLTGMLWLTPVIACQLPFSKRREIGLFVCTRHPHILPSSLAIRSSPSHGCN